MSVKFLLLSLSQTPWTQTLNDIYLQWDMQTHWPGAVGARIKGATRPAFTPHPGGSWADKPGSFVLWKGPLELVRGMWREKWPLPFVPLNQWLVPLSWRCWGPIVVASRLLLPVHHCSAISKLSNRVKGVNGGPVLSKWREEEAQPSQFPAFKVWTWWTITITIFTCYMIFLWESP